MFPDQSLPARGGCVVRRPVAIICFPGRGFFAIFPLEMKKRTLGTIVRGIRAGVVRSGDDPVEVVVEALRESWETEGYRLRDRDVIGVTESLIARAQGNYVSVDEVAQEAREFFGKRCAVVFPILSRNRFSLILRALARGLEEISLLLSYPNDEVGNPLMDWKRLADSGLNPSADLLPEEEFRRRFGDDFRHPFTGLDYLEFYRRIVEGEGARCTIALSNRPEHALTFCREVLAADIHTRFRTRQLLEEAGGKPVLSLDDFCARPRKGRGGNPDYGLLGSNKSGEERLKLFPRTRDGLKRRYVTRIRKKLLELTGKKVEVLIYGDGAFKDPVAGIWELADPVVAVDYTPGLRGTPRELKIKYLIDEKLAGTGVAGAEERLREELRRRRRGIAVMAAQGTTPRQLTDLLGSLCDLTSGSGDKGTPIVLIQGYFDNYTDA